MVRRCFDIGAVSSTGLKRPTNQDRVLALVGELNGDEFGLFAVADGVGGMDLGEFASTYAVSCLKCWWDTRIETIINKPTKELLEQVDTEFEDLLKKLNNDIFTYGINRGQKGGTTLSLIFIYKNNYILKHTGDSRIYLLDGEFSQLTKDQSWVEKVVDKGLLPKKLVDTNAMKNLLTMCLGVFDNLKLQTIKGILAGGAVILLCSDGLYRYFSNDEIKEKIVDIRKHTEKSAQTTANVFLEKVISKGAHDNISLIIVHVKKTHFLKFL